MARLYAAHPKHEASSTTSSTTAGKIEHQAERTNGGEGSSAIDPRRQEKRELILRELRLVPVLGHAARQAGVHPDTLRSWRKSDAAFDAEVIAALEEGVDRLEAETFHQAHQPASQGNPTHLLKMFVLKSRRREVYGERLEVHQQHRHTIVVDLVPPAELGAGQPAAILDVGSGHGLLPSGHELDDHQDDG